MTGWEKSKYRLLEPWEIVRETDKCYNGSVWNDEHSFGGHKASSAVPLYFARLKSEDKEWLNPWD